MTSKTANKLKPVTAKWFARIQGDEYRVLVKAGDKVEVDQPLIEWIKYEKSAAAAAAVLKKMNKDDRQEVGEALKGRKVNKGEVLLKSGGLFPIKVLSPATGEVIGLDEFENIVIRQSDKIIKDKTASPVLAMVDKVEKDRIVLTFKAVELSGRGSDSGKAWGNCKLKVAKNLFEVRSDMAGKILLTEEVSDTFLLKAEVIGVRGVVVIGTVDENDLKTNLPVVSISREEWVKMENMYSSEDEVRVLLNSRLGRVLVVVQ